MSRIPVPTHPHSAQPYSPTPPLHFPTSPDRAASPSPAHYRSTVNNVARTPNSSSTAANSNSMSSVSGFQSNSLSVSDTRKKQSKRDEVLYFSLILLRTATYLSVLAKPHRLFAKKLNMSSPESVPCPQLIKVVTVLNAMPASWFQPRAPLPHLSRAQL